MTRGAVALVVVAVSLCAATNAEAQTPPGASPYPYPYPPPYPYPAQPPPPPPKAEEPKADNQALGNERRLGLGLATGAFLPAGRFTVTSGNTFDLEVVARFPLGKKERLELGLEPRFVRTADATQWAIGVPLRFVAGMGPHLEADVGIVPGYYRIVFDSKYFTPVNAFGTRLQFGLGFPIGTHVVIGLTPVDFTLMGSADVKLLVAWEPRVWVKVGLF
jgi:hypothetical protein